MRKNWSPQGCPLHLEIAVNILEYPALERRLITEPLHPLFSSVLAWILLKNNGYSVSSFLWGEHGKEERTKSMVTSNSPIGKPVFIPQGSSRK